MLGIGKLYSKYLSTKLPPLTSIVSSDDFNENDATVIAHRFVPEKILERCHRIPSFIINCWGYPDTSIRHLVIQVMYLFDFIFSFSHDSQVLQEHILPR